MLIAFPPAAAMVPIVGWFVTIAFCLAAVAFLAACARYKSIAPNTPRADSSKCSC